MHPVRWIGFQSGLGNVAGHDFTSGALKQCIYYNDLMRSGEFIQFQPVQYRLRIRTQTGPFYLVAS
jgi:hypothetical protein